VGNVYNDKKNSSLYIVVQQQLSLPGNE